MKRLAINANDNTITSFAGEINPTGVKEYIYITTVYGHCWRSRDELISHVLQWTPTYGRTKAGRPARTYIQQLCEDTGRGPEDLPEAMNDMEKWHDMMMMMMIVVTISLGRLVADQMR